MKFLVSQIAYFVGQRESRRNLRALVKYLVFLVMIVAAYTVSFHLIMVYVEEREFSWLSGLYWTLTVMTTLGFGDITFQSDAGRAFSILVLMSGVILLLIMLPFAFIRYFYAPWLEAQIHSRSPRSVPSDTDGHVIICDYDSIAPNLIGKLRRQTIPYYLILNDAARASELHHDGLSVIYGDTEDVDTYRLMRAEKARMIVANASDTVNTNIVLTVREIAPHVPIAAIVESIDSVDILELSGATHVLALKQLLGERLADRVNVGPDRVHVVGRQNSWLVAEFNVHGTTYSGQTLSETGIREDTGANIIGVWDRGRLMPALSERRLSDASVAVVAGTHAQVNKLNEHLRLDVETQPGPVLIIGGGKVGRAAANALKARGREVFMVELKKEMATVIGDCADRLTIGDAADRKVLERAGLNECSLVILSTNQDAVNIYLSIYCRRLNPDVRIVSRVTYDRNIEAIHRAGADFVLSYAPIGAEKLMSLIQGRESIMLGENIEFSNIALPKILAGKTLGESRIGELTGVIIVAVDAEVETIVNPRPDYRLEAGSRLNLLGTSEQLRLFNQAFTA